MGQLKTEISQQFILHVLLSGLIGVVCISQLIVSAHHIFISLCEGTVGSSPT